MRLYLMRHGIAEDPRPGQTDASRALTPRGRDRLAAQARAFARLAVPGTAPGAWMREPWACDVLLASPYMRAADTAAVVAKVFGVAVTSEPALAAGADLDDYADVLTPHETRGHVWVVTHEPDLSQVVEVFTGARVEMRKGTVAVLDVRTLRARGATLLGLYDPDVLAALGR